MKKTITILLIFILLFSTLPQNRVWATDEEAVEQIYSGKVQYGNGMVSLKPTDSKFNLIGSILTYVVLPAPLIVQILLTMTILPDLVTKVQIFTIEDLLFGRYELFNVDFMNVSQYTGADSPVYVASSTNVLIKENVAKWFYAMRNFAIVALLAVLIYIGILMAISTIASERAKYKNMLIHWVVSFAILMILPYIMALAMNVCEWCVGVIRSVAENVVQVQVNNPQIEPSKGLNFELTLLNGRIDENGNGFEGILTKILKGESWESFALVIVYCMLAYYQFKFFFLYLRRMLTVGFLVVISPLITITYSIDKAGDNQAQAFKTWLKEFLVNIFIQPLHALLFLIFMYSIYGIMERAPLLAIVFLAALSRGEQLVRSIFKIERTATFGGLRRKGK